MGDSTTPFQVRFSILGDRILYSYPSGLATSAITKKSVGLAKKVEDHIHEKYASYVQIENLEHISEFTINARLTYINHFKDRTGISHLIFLGVSYLDSLSIKLAAKFYKFDFSIKIVDSYQEAVSMAEDIVKQLNDKPLNSNINPDRQIDNNNQKKIKIQTQSDPSWAYVLNGYTAKYEIINNNIIHCEAAGSFSTEQIEPMINIQKLLYSEVKHHSQGYYMIADVTNVVGTDYKGRLNYIRAQNNFTINILLNLYHFMVLPKC